MELVYLWVEEYKNIKQQGFNFSPNFECEFKPVYDDGELTNESELILNKKENPLKDFFGKNINVTAIVGENGSGKTNILEMLFVPHGQRNLSFKYIIFFKIEKEVFYYPSFLYADIIKIRKYDKIFMTDFEINDVYNVNIVSSLSKVQYDPFISKKNQQLNEHFFGKMSYFQSVLIKTLMLSLKNEKFSLNYKNIKFSKLKMNIKKIYITQKIQEFEFDEVNKLFDKIYKLIDRKENEQKFDSFLKLPSLKELLRENIIIGIFNIFIYVPEHKNKLDFLDWEYNEITYEKLIDLFDGEEEILLIIKLVQKLTKILELNIFEKKVEGSREISYEYVFDMEKKSTFLIDFIKEYSVFISKYSEEYFEFQMIDIDLFSKENLSLSNFSAGEKELYSKIIDLKYEFLFNKNNYFLLFDEPDNFLHPNWAKELIQIFLKNLPKDKSKMIHLIITTHSPFILCDMPKENVIFLEKNGKKGSCINVTKKININPFGANIHTLLSHGFFMKDGLMGEFAKDKINEVITYLKTGNSKVIKSNEEAQNIINIIGEPILQKNLQKMLSNKLEITNKNEIDKLKKEIALLKEKVNKNV